MKKLVLIIALIPSIANAQALHLDTCVAHAYRNFKYSEQSVAYGQAQELAIKDAGKTWLPKAVLDFTATYQNEQIEIPVAIPGFDAPVAPLNINRLVVNFSQNIYDGSMSANKKKLENSKYAIQQSQLETEKIQLKSKVIGLFMGIQLATENLKLLQDKQILIAQRLEVLNNASLHGAATEVNVKLLEAELLKLNQLSIEATHVRLALLASLSQIMGTELPENQTFVKPNPHVVYNTNVDKRPEIQVLSMQMENIELQKGMMGTTRLPKINAFGTLGIGNPGYDIFKEELSPMGMIGLKLQWNILDWGYANNEKQILTINQSVIAQQQNRARIQLTTELKNQQTEILKYENLLASDKKLVELREDVSKIKAAELDNGTITTTDYLVELDAEDEAKLNEKMHELKLVMAKLNYINIQGN